MEFVTGTSKLLGAQKLGNRLELQGQFINCLHKANAGLCFRIFTHSR